MNTLNTFISPEAILMLALGGVVVYIAYKSPNWGTAIMAGVGVIGLLVILVSASPGNSPPGGTSVPPAATGGNSPSRAPSSPAPDSGPGDEAGPSSGSGG